MGNVISFCDYRQKRIEERAMDELIDEMSEEELVDLVAVLCETKTVLDNYEMGSFTFTLVLDDTKDTP